MPLENPNVIDMITKPKNGKLELVVTDAGVTTEPRERFEKLLSKLKTYVNWVLSDDFKKDYAGVKPRNVTITVLCANEPTPQMKQLSAIMPKGDRENAIKVNYSLLRNGKIEDI